MKKKIVKQQVDDSTTDKLLINSRSKLRGVRSSKYGDGSQLSLILLAGSLGNVLPQDYKNLFQKLPKLDSLCIAQPTSSHFIKCLAAEVKTSQIRKLVVEESEVPIDALFRSLNPLESIGIHPCTFENLKDDLRIIAARHKTLSSFSVSLSDVTEQNLHEVINKLISLESDAYGLRNLRKVRIRGLSGTPQLSETFYESLKTLIEKHGILSDIDLGGDPLAVDKYLGEALRFNEKVSHLIIPKYKLIRKKEVEYGCAKIMFIGRSGAGKTTTQKHLFNEKFSIKTNESTVVADAKQVGAVAMKEGQNWQQSPHEIDWAEKELQEAVRDDFVGFGDLDTYRKAKEELIADFSSGSSEIVPKRLLMTQKLAILGEETPTEKVDKPKSGLIANIKQFGRRKRNPQVDTAEDHYKFSLWDLGGQEVFCSLHHLFFTDDSLFIYVINLKTFLANQEEEDANFRFWFTSLGVHAPDARVVIALTHIDTLGIRDVSQKSAASHLEKANERIVNLIGEFIQVVVDNPDQGLCYFPISNDPRRAQKTNISSIRSAVERLVHEDGIFVEPLHAKIPLTWLQYMDHIKSLGECVPLQTLKQEWGNFKLAGDLEEALLFFNKVGRILYFSTLDQTSNNVVLNPELLMRVFGRFIMDKGAHSSKTFDSLADEYKGDFMSYMSTAIITRKLLIVLLGEFVTSEHETDVQGRSQLDFIIRLATHLLILCRHAKKEQEEKEYMVAPIFDTLEPPEIALIEKPADVYVKFGTLIPQGFFCRILGYFAQQTLQYKELTVPQIKRGYGRFNLSADLTFEIFENPEKDKICFCLTEQSLKKADHLCRLVREAFSLAVSSVRGRIRFEIFCVVGNDVVSFEELNKALDDVKYEVRNSAGVDIDIRPFKHFYVSGKPVIGPFDCFLSHAWGPGQESHNKVLQIYKLLTEKNTKCWVHELHIKNHIHMDTAQGLSASNKFILFIDRHMDERIQDKNDLAAKEFDFIKTQKKKPRIYVALDEIFTDLDNWSERLRVGGPDHAEEIVDMSSEDKIQQNLDLLVDTIMAE